MKRISSRLVSQLPTIAARGAIGPPDDRVLRQTIGKGLVVRGKDLVLVLDAGLLLANAVPRRHDVSETTRRDDVVVQFRNRVEIAQIEERVAGADVVPAVGAVDLDGDVPRGVPDRLEDPDARDHLELVALDGLNARVRLVGGLESERGILVGLVVQGDRVLGELVLAPVDEDPGVVELLEIWPS